MVNLGTIQPSRRFLRLIIFFAVASLLLVLIVLYFSLSSAHILLFPKEETAKVEYQATIDASQTYDPARLDQVPGRIETVDKEGTKEVKDISEKAIPDYAHVTVTIYNKQGAAQGLLPSTQLVNADGIKFRTDQSVNVPAGGSIQVGATADQTGKEYNVKPCRFSIIKLSPQLQQLVWAESSEQATGGERFVEAAVKEDISQAQEALIKELEDDGKKELQKRLEGTEQYVPEAVKLEILEQNSSVDANTETSEFEVSAKIQLATVVFDENNLLQLSIAKLTASIDKNKELVSYNPDTFKYEIASFDKAAGTAQLKASLEGVARPRLSNEFFNKEQVKGLRKGEVLEHYQKYPDIDHVTVKFIPFWIQSVPTIIDKISIEIGQSESLKTQKAVESNNQTKTN